MLILKLSGLQIYSIQYKKKYSIQITFQLFYFQIIISILETGSKYMLKCTNGEITAPSKWPVCREPERSVYEED